MPNLSEDYKGLNLRYMAHVIDLTFGFASQWESTSRSDEGCYEYQGRIVVDLDVIDQLCELMNATKADSGQVFRYVLAHLKTHHFQELYPTYDKPYTEDMRPYELEADIVSGWICANARIVDLFRTHGMSGTFNDFHRLNLMKGAEGGAGDQDIHYPWPEEKDFAFRRGARMWATGRITEYNPAAAKQGMEDETFAEFLAGVPMVVRGLWLRPVPSADALRSATEQGHHLDDRVPVAGGSMGR